MFRRVKKIFRKHQGTSSLVLSIILFLVGVGLIVTFIISQDSSPTTKNGVSQSSSNQPKKTDGTDNNFLGYSEPVSLSIPAIDVSTSIIKLGKNANGSIQVPGKDDALKAAWYKYSPTPGQAGASIIEGHVDYTGVGPAVFYRLNELRVGDEISVKRNDGKTVRFSVNKVGTYDKDSFPSKEVYRAPNRAALRLITCGGSFNSELGQYESNTIVFATKIID